MLAIHAIAKPNRNIPLCLIFPAIFLLFELNIGATQTIKNQASGSETLHSSTKNCEESADLCHKKSRRQDPIVSLAPIQYHLLIRSRNIANA